MVYENKEGYLGITYDKLTVLLTQAVKDQANEIKKLKNVNKYENIIKQQSDVIINQQKKIDELDTKLNSIIQFLSGNKRSNTSQRNNRKNKRMKR